MAAQSVSAPQPVETRSFSLVHSATLSTSLDQHRTEASTISSLPIYWPPQTSDSSYKDLSYTPPSEVSYTQAYDTESISSSTSVLPTTSTVISVVPTSQSSLACKSGSWSSYLCIEAVTETVTFMTRPILNSTTTPDFHNRTVHRRAGYPPVPTLSSLRSHIRISSTTFTDVVQPRATNNQIDELALSTASNPQGIPSAQEEPPQQTLLLPYLSLLVFLIAVIMTSCIERRLRRTPQYPTESMKEEKRLH